MCPAKTLKSMDFLFGKIFQQVPETCPLSRSASVVSRDEVLKYRSMAPLPLSKKMHWTGGSPMRQNYQSLQIWQEVIFAFLLPVWPQKEFSAPQEA